MGAIFGVLGTSGAPVDIHQFENLAVRLSRSLLMCALLRKAGVPANLRIGVQNANETIEAHAWVECQDVEMRFDYGRKQEFAAMNTATQGD